MFQAPIEESSDDESDLVRAIGETLIHEVDPLLRSLEGADRGNRTALLPGARRGGDSEMTKIPKMKMMRMETPSDDRRHRPRKRLRSTRAGLGIRRVVQAIGRQPGDVFLEIGAGQGVSARTPLP